MLLASMSMELGTRLGLLRTHDESRQMHPFESESWPLTAPAAVFNPRDWKSLPSTVSAHAVCYSRCP